MARQVAERLAPNPVLEAVDELKGFVAPKIDKLKQQLESPDAQGKAEAYFSSLSTRERKSFLIDEMGDAARVLANLSADLEGNLHFYNTAPDNNVKKRVMKFFFPDGARHETSAQKVVRVAREIGTGKLTKPNLISKTGATERWRRRVFNGIDIFLEERSVMKRIQNEWNHPSKMVRDEFHALVLFNLPVNLNPEVVFTPLGMIVVLSDDDYDLLVDTHLQDVNSPQQSSTSGAALTKHELLPALNGRITFIRDTHDDEEFKKIVRHELFHLYFNRFIRKQRLSKVQELIEFEGKANTVERARKLIATTLVNLQSLILEETSAYLFNTDESIDPDRAAGFAWEETVRCIERDLRSNVSPEVLQETLMEARVAQGKYLREARSLQSCVSALLLHLQGELPDADDEELKRNFLFLMSQWGPQRMAQFSMRLGIDQKVVDKEEATLSQGLQEDMRRLFTRLTSGQRDKGTKQLLVDVRNEAAWLYPGETVSDLYNLCWYLINNKGELSDINSLLRSLENSVVARQKELTLDEENKLRTLVVLLKQSGKEKLRRHAPVIERLQKQFSAA
jgi:hypothetical protein